MTCHPRGETTGIEPVNILWHDFSKLYPVSDGLVRTTCSGGEEGRVGGAHVPFPFIRAGLMGLGYLEGPRGKR